MGRECCVNCTQLTAAIAATRARLEEASLARPQTTTAQIALAHTVMFDWMTLLVAMAEAFLKALQDSKTNPAPPPLPAP